MGVEVFFGFRELGGVGKIGGCSVLGNDKDLGWFWEGIVEVGGEKGVMEEMEGDRFGKGEVVFKDWEGVFGLCFVFYLFR